jgi:hypothetical protein
MREPRTELLRVRLSRREKDTWKSYAAEQGLDLSAWVRRCCREAVQLERALAAERRR